MDFDSFSDQYEPETDDSILYIDPFFRQNDINGKLASELLNILHVKLIKIDYEDGAEKWCLDGFDPSLFVDETDTLSVLLLKFLQKTCFRFNMSIEVKKINFVLEISNYGIGYDSPYAVRITANKVIDNMSILVHNIYRSKISTGSYIESRKI